MKKNFVFVIVTISVIFSFSSLAWAADLMSIATAGVAGTYYPIGGAIAAAVTKGGKITCTAEAANGSVPNINLVENKEIEMAMAQNDVVYWAYNGQMMFKDTPKKNIRCVAALYPEHVHIALAKDKGIKKIMDIRGKRVSLGAPGSGAHADSMAIFDVVGIDEKKDFESVTYADMTGMANRFKDGQLDVGFAVGGAPLPSFMEVALTKGLDILDFDKELLSELCEKYPFFVASKIPANTYKGVGDVSVPSVVALLITNASMPEDTVYNFLTAMFDNVQDIRNAHSAAKAISLETATDGFSVPAHPGAIKFYKEKGIMK
ncbi:MAG: TAXI family TRAP transporter solute-binding subunit [Synergistaceae bacterium]|nr:TAXI family TRAP transporter solute-binding subunit [Synergistaceae bacterium]